MSFGRSGLSRRISLQTTSAASFLQPLDSNICCTHLCSRARAPGVSQASESDSCCSGGGGGAVRTRSVGSVGSVVLCAQFVVVLRFIQFFISSVFLPCPRHRASPQLQPLFPSLAQSSISGSWCCCYSPQVRVLDASSAKNSEVGLFSSCCPSAFCSEQKTNLKNFIKL